MVFLDQSDPLESLTPFICILYEIKDFDPNEVFSFKVSEKPPHASKSICISIKRRFHFGTFGSRNINDSIIIFFGNNFD